MNIKIMPKIAYIIVAWNNKDLLKDCILSINKQDYSGAKRILVVDNNSSDDTIDYLLHEFPSVELLPQKENYGFAKGNNLAISVAMKDSQVEYIVLLNSDARLANDWTKTLVAFALKKPRLATAQSITLDYYDHSIIDSTHIYLSQYGQATQGSYGYPIGDGYDVPPVKVFGCNAAAMIISRDFIKAQPFHKLFDETMFMYLEDVDLAMRATVMDWDNYTVPGTRAYHMGSVSSSKKDPSFSLYMTFRNNLGLLIKNLPLPILFKLLLRMPHSDYMYIEHLLRQKKRRAATAVVRGRLISIMFIPVFIGKRLLLRRYISISRPYLWHLMERGY